MGSSSSTSFAAIGPSGRGRTTIGLRSPPAGAVPDRLRRYALAVTLALAAVLLPHQIFGTPAATLPLLVLAVFVSAHAGGARPGLLTAVAGGLLGWRLGLELVAAPLLLAAALLGARAHTRLREAREVLELHAALGGAGWDLLWWCEPNGRPESLEWRRRGDAVRGWEGRVFPADLARLRATLAGVFRSGRPADLECRFWRQDGRCRWTWTRIAPVKDEAGRVVRLVGASTEIEARKQAEAALEYEYEWEHSRRVQAEDEARQRERLMAILSHDLRQPLTVIQGSAALLSQVSAERRQPMLELITRNTRRANRMIHELLDYSRIGATGTLPVDPQRVDLAALCAQALEDARAESPGRDFVLEVGGPLWGTFDRERLEQLVANLVGNACRHGRPDRPVRLAARTEEGAAVLEVCNEGAPIPAPLQESIFEPFQRGPEAHQRDVGGLGLGLFIVRAIASAHGGTVTVRSTESEGTTFRVRLPPAIKVGAP